MVFHIVSGICSVRIVQVYRKQSGEKEEKKSCLYIWGIFNLFCRVLENIRLNKKVGG